MNGTAVIVGGGRVGRHTATQLVDHGYTVTIVERDDERVANLTEQRIAHVVGGDGEDPDVLERAGIRDARVVAALTDHTPTNVIVCGLAREVAPEIRTLARVAYDGEREYQHLETIDEIVYPAAAAADIAADRLLRW